MRRGQLRVFLPWLIHTAVYQDWPCAQEAKALGRDKMLFDVPQCVGFASDPCLWCCRARLPMPQLSLLLLHLLSFSRGNVVAGGWQDSPLSPSLFPHICAQPGIICSGIFLLQNAVIEVALVDRHCSRYCRVTQGISLRSSVNVFLLSKVVSGKERIIQE